MNKIPENYLDLANCPRVAALTTIMPDGRPQTTKEERETRIICLIYAQKITLDAIHR